MNKIKKQFCKHGHDTFICGRTAHKTCNECHRLEGRIDPSKDLRVKPFCVNGHDISIVGRDKQDHCRECTNTRHRNKIKFDIDYKLRFNLRNRLSQAIVKHYKAGSAVKDLGCSIDFLKKYIQSKFYDNMSWDNWGIVWELDHIIPLWKFNLTDKEQFKQAVNYKNLQPLTIKDHKEKTFKESKEWKSGK